MPGHDIIVVGASAGGVEALRELVSGLSPDLGAALFVVVHIPAEGRSVLPDILCRNGPLPAQHAVEGEVFQYGHIYVAPPNHHLLVEAGHTRVVLGPKENRARPAADPLFRSAARAYGTRVVGLVLSGMLDDGTAGLLAIKQRGGLAIVQDPAEALYPGMTRSALENVPVDYKLPIAAIPPLLAELAASPAADEGAYPVSEALQIETRIARKEGAKMEELEKLGNPSTFTCPECSGVLWELHEGELLRFRCHVGHAFSAESLLAEQTVGLEGALWAGLRALEEQTALYGRLADQARRHERTHSAKRFEESAEEMEQHAAVLRQVLHQTVGTAEGGRS